jgi:hypothetical protein
MKIYFDTSAINAITDDPLKPKIVDRLTTYHEPLISTLAVSELIATPKGESRYKLLRVASNLTKIADPPYHRVLADEPEMLMRSLQAFLNPSEELDYFRRAGYFPELDVLRNPRIDLAEAALFVKNWHKNIESRYHERMKRHRDEAQEAIKQFPEEEIIKLSRADFLRKRVSQTDALKDYVANNIQNAKYRHLYPKIAGRELEILEKSELWRFYTAILDIDIYNRMVQRDKYGYKSNPGWVDSRQAVYLAAADTFVTNDINQRNFMRIVSCFSLTPKRVWSYAKLKAYLNL